ncbi:MAG: hypothetical protein JWQ66_3981 [Mucilaginibacter sp.]|nr:hypothetical protein [Mucilaginibacter sp.]
MPCVRKHIIIDKLKFQFFNKHYPELFQIEGLYLVKSNIKNHEKIHFVNFDHRCFGR